MRFRVLGEVELVAPDGAAQPLTSPSQRRLLGVLLAHAGHIVSIGTLIEALWDDEPPASALGTLRTYISRLRPHLAGALEARGDGYRLAVTADAVDAGRFDALVLAAAAAHPTEALASLDAALALWRGSAYGDVADVAAIRAEARRLDEARIGALELRAEGLLATGRTIAAVAAAEALVAEHPLHEGAWSLLVQALAAADRVGDALRAYQRAAGALAESGLEPSVRLRETEQAVLAGAAAVPAPAVTRDRAAPSPQRPPSIPSTFVGRAHDCGQLVDLLDGPARVVTLVGPGGVGKTRLALEVARAAAERHLLGASVVELAAVDDDPSVAPAIVAALGLSSDGTSAGETLRRGGRLDLLVVLDNAEHVAGATAAAVEALTGGGDAVRVLVTSRERLGVHGEHVWSVAPLAAGGPDAPAHQLFVDRARATLSSGSALSSGSGSGSGLAAGDDVVERIVRRLDGLPLAIEMAAAQLATTGIEELADALDERIDDLRSPRRHVDERHRSLGAVLAWSEERLTPELATTLAELSVFAGPVTAADVAGVLGRPEAGAQARELVERSLVVLDRTVSPVRFRLLNTVRDLAAARLAGRAGELAAGHARWFAAVVREADAALHSEDELAGHQRIEGALAEIRAAHRYGREHDVALAVELSEHLHLYAYTRLADEPLAWAEHLLAVVPDGDPRRSTLLAGAASRAINRGDLEGARALAEAGVDVAGSGPGGIAAAEVLGDATMYAGLLDDSAIASADLLDRARRVGDHYHAVIAQVALVMVEAYRNTDDAAALAGWLRRLDDVPVEGVAPSAKGWLAYTRGELLLDAAPETAFVHLGQALALARAGGNRFLEGVTLVSISSLQARVGDVASSLTAFAEVVRHWDRLADHTHQLTTLRNLVILLERAGAGEAAAELLGSVEREDVPTYGAEAARLAEARAAMWSALGPRTAEILWRRGHDRDVGDAARWALDVMATLTP